MRQETEVFFDEIYVREILAAAAQRGPMTRGVFDMFTRRYLADGYAREVAEAERRYFHS
jgi:hypothetical protein